MYDVTSRNMLDFFILLISKHRLDMLADGGSSDGSDARGIEGSWKTWDELLLAREPAPCSVCHQDQTCQHPYLRLCLWGEVLCCGEVGREPLFGVFGFEGDLAEELGGAMYDMLGSIQQWIEILLFDIKLDRLCCCCHAISWALLIIGVVSFVVFSQGQCEVLECSGLSPCWRSFCNAEGCQSQTERSLQIYILGVCFLNIRLQDVWVLEVMYEIAKV